MNITGDSLLKEIDPIIIEEIISVGDRKVYDKKQIIYEKGMQANNLFILEQGEIELKGEDEVRFTLSILGDIFGWSSLVKNGIYTTKAISNSISSIIQVPKDEINSVFDRHPNTAVLFYRYLGLNLTRRMKIFG